MYGRHIEHSRMPFDKAQEEGRARGAAGEALRPAPVRLGYGKNVPRHMAFTLVELLVVIGIISILISMLMPALNKARQAAQSIQCLSNLRQIGVGFVIWQNDHHSRYPSYISYDSLDHAVAPGYTDYAFYTGNMVHAGCFRSLAVFDCPSFDRTWPAPVHDSMITADYPNNSTVFSYAPEYAYNYLNIGSSRRWTTNQGGTVTIGTPGPWLAPARPATIAKPSETYVMMDVLCPNATLQYGRWIVDDGPNTTAIPDARHNNSVNVLYADGHTGSVKVRDRGSPYATLGTYLDPNNHWERQ